jgi:hypothetical protein
MRKRKKTYTSLTVSQPVLTGGACLGNASGFERHSGSYFRLGLGRYAHKHISFHFLQTISCY